MTESTATTTISSPRAARLAKQFVSHWGRHADRRDEQGTATTLVFLATPDWPAASVVVDVQAASLTVVVRAADQAALGVNCASIAEHLQRFAGRDESLDIAWE